MYRHNFATFTNLHAKHLLSFMEFVLVVVWWLTISWKLWLRNTLCPIWVRTNEKNGYDKNKYAAFALERCPIWIFKIIQFSDLVSEEGTKNFSWMILYLGHIRVYVALNRCESQVSQPYNRTIQKIHQIFSKCSIKCLVALGIAWISH